MIDLKEIASRIADFINANGGSTLPEDITLEQLAAVCYCIGVRPAIEVVAREVETEPMTTMGELAERIGEPKALANKTMIEPNEDVTRTIAAMPPEMRSEYVELKDGSYIERRRLPLTDIEKAAIALLDAIDMRPEGNLAPNIEFARWDTRIYGPCVRELKRLVTETAGVPYK